MKYILVFTFILLIGLISKTYFENIKLTKYIKLYIETIRSLKKIKFEFNSSINIKTLDDISKFGIILFFKIFCFLIPYFALFSIFYFIEIRGPFLYILPSMNYLFFRKYI